jgi:hypothetical protein
LSDANWLLFLQRDSPIDQFFAGIHIPFDCKLLVAQPGDSHVVTVAEVYRVSPSLPLQTHRLGNWTAGGTVYWSTESFYERRKTLQGIVLKTGTIQVRFVSQPYPKIYFPYTVSKPLSVLILTV